MHYSKQSSLPLQKYLATSDLGYIKPNQQRRKSALMRKIKLNKEYMTERSLNSNSSNRPMKQITFKDNWTRLSRGLNNFKIVEQNKQQIQEPVKQTTNEFEQLLEKINGITDQILKTNDIRHSAKKQHSQQTYSGQKEVSFQQDNYHYSSMQQNNSFNQKTLNNPQSIVKQSNQSELIKNRNKMTVVQELSQQAMSDISSDYKKQIVDIQIGLNKDKYPTSQQHSRPQTRQIQQRKQNKGINRQARVSSAVYRSEPHTLNIEIQQKLDNQAITRQNINGYGYSSIKEDDNLSLTNNRQSQLKQNEEQAKALNNFNTFGSGAISNSSHYYGVNPKFSKQTTILDNEISQQIVANNSKSNRLMSANPRFREKNLMNRANKWASKHLSNISRLSEPTFYIQSNTQQQLQVQNPSSEQDTTNNSIYPESLNSAHKKNKMIINNTNSSGFSVVQSSNNLISTISKHNKFVNKIDRKLYLDRKNKQLLNQSQDQNQAKFANSHNTTTMQDNKENHSRLITPKDNKIINTTTNVRPQSSNIKFNSTYRAKKLKAIKLDDTCEVILKVQEIQSGKQHNYQQEINEMIQHLQQYSKEYASELSQLRQLEQQLMNQYEENDNQKLIREIKDALLNCKVIINLKK